MRPTYKAAIWHYLFGLIIFFAVAFQTSCCHLRIRRIQPKYPDKVRGWVDDPFDRRLFQGPFVLRKGESTENAKLGVRVIDIIPEQCAAFLAERPENAKAILQFYSPSSRQVLCEATVSENSNASIDREEVCKGKVDVSVVGMLDVNAKDNWVIFDLRP